MARPRKNLVGREFGMLRVIEQIPELDANGKVCYLCQCECGNSVIVRGTNLTTRRTTSCGCKHISASELQVSRLLEKAKVPYLRDKEIPGLKDTKPLRSDFTYEIRGTKIMVEIDGIHHFKETKYNHSGKASDLQKQQLHDKLKNEWCKQNGYTMIRIPYTVPYDKITILDLLPKSRFALK